MTKPVLVGALLCSLVRCEDLRSSGLPHAWSSRHEAHEQLQHPDTTASRLGLAGSAFEGQWHLDCREKLAKPEAAKTCGTAARLRASST